MRKTKPQNTYKHLLNFVSKSTIRPLLTTFHITHNGHIEACDSHIMLRLYNRMPAHQEVNLVPKELRELSGGYPNLDRIIPVNHNALWKLDPTEAPAIVKFLKSFTKGSCIRVTAKDQQFVIEDTLADTKSAFPLLEQSGDDIAFHCNATYLNHMMSYIADCAELPVEIRVLSPVRPVVFESEGQFIGLVTPIKIK